MDDGLLNTQQRMGGNLLNIAALHSEGERERQREKEGELIF